MTRRETLIAYLLSSVEAEDWHAVRDAAVDIEVLDAREGRVVDVPPADFITPAIFNLGLKGHGEHCVCCQCVGYRNARRQHDTERAP